MQSLVGGWVRERGKMGNLERYAGRVTLKSRAESRALLRLRCWTYPTGLNAWLNHILQEKDALLNVMW
jgi:hypothetical protein